MVILKNWKIFFHFNDSDSTEPEEYTLHLEGDAYADQKLDSGEYVKTSAIISIIDKGDHKEVITRSGSVYALFRDGINASCEEVFPGIYDRLENRVSTTVVLKKWSIFNRKLSNCTAQETGTFYLQGNISGYPNEDNGDLIESPPIVAIFDKGDHKEALTFSGEKYLLYEEDLNEECEKQFPGYYDRIGTKDPFSLKKYISSLTREESFGLFCSILLFLSAMINLFSII